MSHLYYAATCPLSANIACSRGAAARDEYQRVRQDVESPAPPGGSRVGITGHPLWPDIRPCVRIEIYDRDGGHRRPRFRIEVRPATPALAAAWLRATMPCVACGQRMHPIRDRTQAGAAFRKP